MTALPGRLLGGPAALLGAVRARLDPSAFHPELRLHARLLPGRPVTALTLPLMRRLGDLVPEGQAEVVEIGEHVSVRVHRPTLAAAPGPALLWIHGGGYVFGSARQNDRLCRTFADELNAVVAAVEYRLAPEHPYPAALDDCYDALQWLGAQPEIDPERIAVAGASAGGGLAAALAFAARDRGGVRPVLQVLSYPMLDDRSTGTELETGTFRLWNTAANRFGWRAYLGGADPAAAVPARRTDLAGLAPAWIGVGTLDLFHAEDLAYAERLRAAGVEVRVLEVPGAFHGFDEVAADTGVARDYIAAQVVSLRAALTA
ncbi:alpha/beta hydrolase [Nocardia jiangsuensis]|uniref:Alpha/beta hydrolase n=1 Tax=Nocardia jiangsuensis TaxID=1691563 RepID=A0ABV8DZH8_9NOCA